MEKIAVDIAQRSINAVGQNDDRFAPFAFVSELAHRKIQRFVKLCFAATVGNGNRISDGFAVGRKIVAQIYFVVKFDHGNAVFGCERVNETICRLTDRFAETQR